jgi:hypothetical protein
MKGDFAMHGRIGRNEGESVVREVVCPDGVTSGLADRLEGSEFGRAIALTADPGQKRAVGRE